MSGRPKKSWNSTSNVVVPALLGSVEATWIATWIGALAHLAPFARVDVPFLAVAVPLALAAILTGLSALPRWPLRGRVVVVALALAVLVAVSSATLGALYFHASLASVVVNPFGERAVAHQAASSLAWLVAVIAVLRGGWLGWSELRVRRVFNSLLITALAFVVYFIAAEARRGEASFHGGVSAAVVLVLIAFPVAIAVAAVVNERDLERSSSLQHHPRPSAAWLATVMVPMAAVSAIGLLLTYAVAPAVPRIGRLIGAFFSWLIRLVGDALAWLGPLIHLRARALPHTVSGKGGTMHLPHGSGNPPVWVEIVSIGLVALVAAVLFGLVLRWIRRQLRKRANLRTPAEAIESSERDSVFSWSHLLDQLWLWLAHRLRRRTRAVAVLDLESLTLSAAGERERSIRLHFRDVLVAARAVGKGRSRSETALEFDARLSYVLDPAALPALHELSTLYERARYGEHASAEADVDRAGVTADVVVRTLLAPPPEEEQ